jgi:hypothetical protein
MYGHAPSPIKVLVEQVDSQVLARCATGLLRSRELISFFKCGGSSQELYSVVFQFSEHIKSVLPYLQSGRNPTVTLPYGMGTKGLARRKPLPVFSSFRPQGLFV